MDLIVLLLIATVVAIVSTVAWITTAQENTRLRKANAAFSPFDRDHDGKPGGSLPGR